jgi:sarcosine oxidase/L-pipecolate oxidase
MAMRTRYLIHWSLAVQKSCNLIEYFQFLPVIGRLVADLVEEKLDTELITKFAVERKAAMSDPSRTGEVKRLDLNQLCTAEDLIPGGGQSC